MSDYVEGGDVALDAGSAWTLWVVLSSAGCHGVGKHWARGPVYCRLAGQC